MYSWPSIVRSMPVSVAAFSPNPGIGIGVYTPENDPCIVDTGPPAPVIENSKANGISTDRALVTIISAVRAKRGNRMGAIAVRSAGNAISNSRTHTAPILLAEQAPAVDYKAIAADASAQ